MDVSPQLLNVTLYPPNSQFYQYGPSGVLNQTSCWGDVEYFLSLPFFRDAHDYAANNSKFGISNNGYENLVNDGLSYMIIDPSNGELYESQVFWQYNVPMTAIPSKYIPANASNDALNLANIVTGVMSPTMIMTTKFTLKN